MKTFRCESCENAYVFVDGMNSVLAKCTIAPFSTDGETFATPEHYYQYKKALHFNDLHCAACIKKCRTAKKCKSLGCSVKYFSMKEWLHHAECVMRNGYHQMLLQTHRLFKSSLQLVHLLYYMCCHMILTGERERTKRVSSILR